MYANTMAHYSTREGLGDVGLWTDSINFELRDKMTLTGARHSQRVINVPERDIKLTVESTGDEPWLESVIQDLVDLLKLPSNWDSYGARSINSFLVCSALELLLETMQPDTPVPAVVPTCQGGIQLEWHTRGIDLEIEIKSLNRFYVFYEDHLHNTEWEGELTSDLTRLDEFISELSRHR